MRKSDRLTVASLAIIAMILASSSVPVVTVAQSINEGNNAGSIVLWVPPKMLAGEKYSGVVTVAEPASYDRDVLLVSDNPEVVKVPERVTIKANMHQAIFDIQVVATGQLSRSSTAVSVSAVMSGGLVSKATATVYDASMGAGNAIRLLVFEKTALSFARVVVVAPEGSSSSSSDSGNYDDDKGKEVTLVYPAGTSKVTIDSTTGYGVADVPLVDGDNRISVFGRPGDVITVTRVPVDPAITVKISSLSTVPAWSPEWGYQRSWVLVDAERNGKPIRGGDDNGDFIVTATSSNPDVLEIEQAFWRKSSMSCDLPCAIPIRGHSEGNAQIGVHISGIGGGTVDITSVTPVRHGASRADIEGLAGRYISSIVGPSMQFTIDSVSLSSYSSEKAISSAVTDGPVYGLVGHYATLSANYTTVDATTNSTAFGQFSKKVPLVVLDASYYMSSSGDPVQVEWSDFNGLLKGDVRQQKSNAITGGTPGAVVKSMSVGIGSSYAAMSTFNVMLNDPVGHAEQKGELTAAVLDGSDIRLAGYVSPADGALRSYAEDVVGNRGVFTSLYVPPPLEAAAAGGGSGSGGQPGQAVPPLPLGEPGQGPQGQAPQQLPTQTQTQPTTTNIQQQQMRMEVDVPPLSYPAEGFVFAAHIVAQQGGAPVRKVTPLYELGRGDAGMAGKAQEIDGVFIYDRYVETVKAKVVMNAIDIHVDWPDVLKLNRQVNMTLTSSVPGVSVSVSGEVRGELVDIHDDNNKNGITVATVALYSAGAEGDRKVVVSVTKQGWMTATAEKVIPARKYEILTIDATSSTTGMANGTNTSIHASFTLTYSTIDNTGNNSVGDNNNNLPNQSQSQKTISGITPYVLDERPLVSRSVTFGSVAEPAENNGTRYAYTGRTMDRGDRITGMYERQVQLVVTGGSGGGYYSPGQQAVIEAEPDRQVLGFAVVEKFSHWEYDNRYLYMPDARARSGQATIIATPGAGGDIVEASAMYVTDYSILAVMVISTMAAIGAYAYRSEIRTILDTYRKRDSDDVEDGGGGNSSSGSNSGNGGD